MCLVLRIYSFGGMDAPCTYCMTGDSYRRRFRLLLCSCDVFGVLINSHCLLVLHTVKRPYTGLILFQKAIIVLNTFPASVNPLCVFRFVCLFVCFCCCFCCCFCLFVCLFFPCFFFSLSLRVCLIS